MCLYLKKNIAKEEIEQLPPYVYAGEITIVEDEKKADELARELSLQSVLGFDTETRPAFRKGEHYNIALLQLATAGQVYLFRLNKCGFRPALQDLLANPYIVKVGVGIRDDIRSLRKMSDFLPVAFVELQDYVTKFGIEDKSFSKLMAIIFGVKISKRQRTTNWEAEVLTDSQIRYAATDAWGALKMYQRISMDLGTVK